MAKTKTCSFCGKDVPRLWYSNPPTCAAYQCKQKRNEGKGSNKNAVPKRNQSKIKPISDKQSKRLQEYRKARDLYMRANPICECCNTATATDLHHSAGRTGDLLTNIEYFKALCRGCHTEVELNPKWAKENGLSVNRLDK